MKKLRSLKLLGLACVLAVALVFIGIEFVQAQVDTLGKPPDKPKPTPDALIPLEDNDIITTESNALRVWRSISGNGYECSWSTESPGYKSVAVGDVDGDGSAEIVVPGSYEVKKGKGKSAYKFLKIFLNVYKQGETGIWQSTEDYDCIVEEVGYNHTEIMIADVDSDSNNEVIILTYHNLAVFKYDGSGQFKIENQITSKQFTSIDQPHFGAVTAGNIDKDAANEIFVSVSAWNGDKGCVYILDGDLSLIETETFSPPFVNAYLGSHSLRVADLDGDDTPEICSTGFSEFRPDDESLWQAYIFVWHKSNDNGGWVLSETPVDGWEDRVNQYPYVYLDVGEVTDSPGNEIVVSSKYPEQYSPDYQLILYDLKNDGDLVQIGETYVLHDQEDVFDVEIGDANSEIIVAGRTRLRRSPVFYLEVFDSEFKTIWKRIGERAEGWVFDTAINE
jgi:hypothetical protein